MVDPVLPTVQPEPSSQEVDLPVVTNAKQDLAERLSIPPEQITVVSVEEVAWPDGCLGIRRPGLMCTQAIVPGYRIILEANGVQYEYRTNLSGSQIALAGPLPGGESAPDSSAAQMVWVQIIDGVCRSATIQGSQIDYGLCGEAPTTAMLADGQRLADLNEFSTLYQPFESETAAGKLVFQGRGPVTATPSQQRMLAAWAALAAQETELGRGDSPLGLVLDWRREGGIAGVCQHVSLYADGTAWAEDCRPAGSQPTDPAQSLGKLRLTSSQLEQLFGWQDSLANFEWNTPPPLPADGFNDQLVFTGSGTNQPSASELEMTQKLSEEIYLQLSTPQDEGSLQAALAVLQDYLGALRDGRYADAGGLYSGSLEFIAAMNPDIAADDAASLFERYCSQNGGVCGLSIANLVHQAQLGQDSFRFTVELSTPEGELFRHGPCCGDDQSPPLTQFDFWVRLHDGLLRVETLPPYVP